MQSYAPSTSLFSTKEERWLLIFAFALCLLARGSSLFAPIFNADDLVYWPYAFDFDILKLGALREGRFFLPIIAEFLTALGVNSPHAFTLSATVLMLCQSVSAILVCRLWKITDSVAISGVVIAILVLHPYQADFSTWRITQFLAGVPFVMTLWSLLICTRGITGFIVAVATTILALGIHQVPLEMASCVLIFSPFISLIRDRFNWREWLVRLAALAIATILYVLTAKIIIAYSDHLETIGRDTIILISNPDLVLRRAGALLSELTQRDLLIGWLVRLLFLGLVAVSLYDIAFKPGISSRNRFLLIFFLLTTTVAAFLCAVSLTIVPLSWAPVYRNLLSIEIIWAAFAAISLTLSSGLHQRFVLASITLILFGFAGSNNQVLTDQERVNRRDILMMNQISYRVATLDNFDQVRSLLFIGTNTKNLSSIHTAADYTAGYDTYGTTISIFAVWWPGYLVQLYREVTGLVVWAGATPEQKAWAEKNCEARAWPAKDSVFGQGEVAVVCLGPPAKRLPSLLEIQPAS